jgi:hypothetical protein
MTDNYIVITQKDVSPFAYSHDLLLEEKESFNYFWENLRYLKQGLSIFG